MVLSRALSLAAVTLVVGCCAMGQAAAQENLDAGKSPSQIFSGTCTACHKSARGLLKTVAPGSLQGFLRQHYTTSPEMAGVLASYLMSNGAADTRYGDKQKGAKDGKDGKDGKQTRSEAKPETKPETGSVQGETERAGRKRLARPAETPDAGKPAAEAQAPQAASEHEGRKSRRLSKRGKPGVEEEAPKGLEKPIEPAREEAAAPAKPEPAKPEPVTTETVPSQPAKPEESATPVEAAKPAEGAAQSANADAAKAPVNEALPPSLRRDPVPAVTPAPSAAAAPAPSVAPAPATPSVTASAPPPAPTEPSTPPAPPISR